MKSIRELAEDFDKRSGALMTDGRRTLGDISRAVNNFDRNPTRVLFGASNSSAPAAAPPPAEAPKPRAGRKRQAAVAVPIRPLFVFHATGRSLARGSRRALLHS